MLAKLFNLRPQEVEPTQDDLSLAVAALLVEAACMDGTFDADERATIERLLRERMDIPAADLDQLMDSAQAAVEESSQLWGWARTVKDRFDPAQRIGMIEMLWEVVYADGVLDDFEANLLRRIAGLIYVDDRDSGAARKRILARRGLDG